MYTIVVKVNFHSCYKVFDNKAAVAVMPIIHDDDSVSMKFESEELFFLCVGVNQMILQAQK